MSHSDHSLGDGPETMRLLSFNEDGSLALTEYGRNAIPQYAILSHTWGVGEVAYDDLLNGTADTKNGYQKIIFCGRRTIHDGLKYFWVDTCCIDKRNFTELTTAINSMFLWYQRASKCYVYLTDVTAPSMTFVQSHHHSWEAEFCLSRWFTRGWTLQELIAPTCVEFFSREGNRLGDKKSLELQICEITRIPTQALQGQALEEFSVSERLSWVENRETTEEEDIAYCLLGIFNVSMPLVYAEGKAKALTRLKEEVEKSLYGNLRYEQGRTTRDLDPTQSSFPSGALRNFEERRHIDGDTSDVEGTMRRTNYLLKALLGIQSEDGSPDLLGEMNSSMAAQALALISRIDIPRANLPVIIGPWHRAFALSSDVAQGCNAVSIFENAYNSFLDILSDEDEPRFMTFKDPSEMIDYLQGQCEKSKESSKLQMACMKIKDFTFSWEHFFGLVELAEISDPKWPGVAWGAVGLVFVVSISSQGAVSLLLKVVQLGKKYPNLFEKLAEMLNDIAKYMPSYHNLVLQLQIEYPRDEEIRSDIAKALAFVYADILQFCRDACMMFTKGRNGKFLFGMSSCLLNFD